MKNKSMFSAFAFIIIAGIGLLWARYVYDPMNILQTTVTAIASVIAALIVSSAIRIADPCDKAVVLRMVYEGLNQNSTIVIVPSSAVETMGLGSMAGLTALTMGIGAEKAGKTNEALVNTADYMALFENQFFDGDHWPDTSIYLGQIQRFLSFPG